MAKKVVFYQYDFAKDKQVASGSLIFDGKKVTAVGSAARLLPDLEEIGIHVPGKPRGVRVYPKDGLRFMELLKVRFDNPYLRASDVMNV